jgi:hypothetical protein
MVASCEVKGDISIFPGAGTRQTDFDDEMRVRVSKYPIEVQNDITESYQMTCWMSITLDTA